ncbi:MAG: hypothetical protein GTO51_08615 [Candidatus Latescibacteria bacterium]|nr:hypothetical protein [Candidatus Latescibacterota bacterium]NIM22016.1 hypothetical protein [Candidatus Latescibacterota bacterium]NIM66034.1 hypothetical protein [Candidatus Latescibacterota bacterium]NIO02442.1 hypothetical protein [Candidatus Latescibacterota bacterium]NIO29353.1 hypothetical protein [Candidatus Latescibacterota bacterium]
MKVRKGCSMEQDEARAVRELATKIKQPGSSVSCIFASSNFDLEKLGSELRSAFRGPVIGCTTSGEITPQGYAQGTLCGFSIVSKELKAHPFMITSLKNFDATGMEDVVKSLQNILSRTLKVSPEARAFGLLFIDGLCTMEEQVVAILANALEDVPIVGGSAGDDLKFEKTHVYSKGGFVSDAGIFTLFVTTLPFTPIKTQHFRASDTRLVITKASPEKRIVYEINGRPAAQEYARVVGIDTNELAPMVFSTYPVMLRFGGEYYVRSIQKMNEDGSLTFYCAIDEGLVLRIANGENLVDNLSEAFEQARIKIPRIKLTIGCDCILRLLEVKHKGLQDQVNKIMMENNVVGFNTYGEQFNSVHVNQTFTGIVLGE